MTFSMHKHFGNVSILSNNFGIGPLPFRKDVTKFGLLNSNCIPTSTVIVKKSIFGHIGYFDERKIFIGIEDNDLWIRVSEIGKISFVPKVLVLHRNHERNTLSKTKTIFEARLELFKKHGLKTNNVKISWIKNNKIYFLVRNTFNYINEKLFQY